MRTKSDWGKALRSFGKQTSKTFFTGKTIAKLGKEKTGRTRKEKAKWEKEQIKSLKRQGQLRQLRAKEETRKHPLRGIASPYLRTRF